MSSKHICLCGKNHGKEPIVITVTCGKTYITGINSGENGSPISECDKTHPETPETTKGNEESNYKPVDNSAKELKHVEHKDDATNQNQHLVDEEFSDKNNKTEETKNFDDHLENTNLTSPEVNDTHAMDSNDTDEIKSNKSSKSNESNKSNRSNRSNTSNKSNNASIHSTDVDNKDSEFLDADGNDLEQNDINKVQEEPVSDELNNAESDTENKDGQNQTVMHMTNIAINTKPFFDSIFLTKDKYPKSTENECEACMVDILVLGKHVKGCKYCLPRPKLDCSFNDGNATFKTIGTISFPTNCSDIAPDPTNARLSCIFNGPESKYTELDNYYWTLFRKLEGHIKTDILLDKLNKNNNGLYEEYKQNKNILENNSNQDRMEQLEENSPHCSFAVDSPMQVQTVKMTTSRSVQIVPIGSKTKTRWYNLLLACFGTKNDNESTYHKIEDKYSTLSTCELSKYLKI
ncbi:myb-like protein X [Sitophilus oryzae]|uniref:Myb-like protein X n=1 Tax=Sitophilus oryzae TaxID=7048 RepID=A0A6J2X2P6_SITOR|nr:myb-like protein X [Sitophilus oryzae]